MLWTEVFASEELDVTVVLVDIDTAVEQVLAEADEIAAGPVEQIAAEKAEESADGIAAGSVEQTAAEQAEDLAEGASIGEQTAVEQY